MSLRGLAKSESGAALVELAVVTPFLALLLTGLIDFGRYTYDAILAANAARAAAAYGAQTLVTARDTNGMKAAANGDAAGLTLTNVAASSVCTVGGAVVACGTSTAETVFVQVNTTGTYTPLVKYPFLPSTVTVSGSSYMRVEQQ
jgi:Flp pilus assembly protein TadG